MMISKLKRAIKFAGQFRNSPGDLARLPQNLRLSFSQFGEDQALARLLRPSRQGTYVDVGANDPIDGSNTAFLYMLGWSGLAIDPNPAFAQRFRRLRPRDTFLTTGVSMEPSELTYYEFAHHQLNTFSTPRAEQLRAEGTPPTQERKIACAPLSVLIKRHLAGRHIDLLSIDCEGLDLEVLRSADLSNSRPTVLSLEDFGRYCSFRDGGEQGEFDQYLRSQSYSPIYQAAWSSIYVADDWRSHTKTGAFDPPASMTDYMPKPRDLMAA